MTTPPPAAYTNPLSTLMTDPIRNFKFLVTFKPKVNDLKWGAKFTKMGFVSLSGLSVSTESIAYREGGYNTNVHQIPGQSQFTPISLSRGVMLGNNENALWMKRLFSVMSPTATSGVGANFRVDIDIQVLSHPNPKAYGGSDADPAEGATVPINGTGALAQNGQHTSLRFKVYNAWISSLAYSNLDAGANTLMVEEMSLVHEGFDVVFGTGYTTAGSAAELK
jgi:phage tail-like protein